MPRNGVVSAARSRAAKTHASRAHYCSCGRVLFGNGSEWSHRRKCKDGTWLTLTQWNKMQEATGYAA